MHKNKPLGSVTALAASILVCVFSNIAAAAELEQVGSFDFPTSGSPAAQAHFELGVGYLHSFGMTQAQEEFRAAQFLWPKK
jgi:Tfp pilus assembly protein PilF